jgi:hypothetical protein
MSCWLQGTQETQKYQGEHASASNGTKSSTDETQKESYLPHVSSSDIISMKNADIALKRKAQHWGKSALQVSMRRFKGLKISVAQLWISIDLFFRMGRFMENVEQTQRGNLIMPLQIRTQKLKNARDACFVVNCFPNQIPVNSG